MRLCELQPGEIKKLSIKLDENAFSYYNVEAKQWVEESIEYEIEVGASIKDIRLSDRIKISALKFADPYRTKDIESYKTVDIKNVSRQEFERLYGEKLPEHRWDRSAKLTLNDILDINYIIEEITKFNSLERIQALEQKVLELEKAQKQIFESLYHRVSNETFNTWLKALEKQLGVEIISQQFSAPYPK